MEKPDRTFSDIVLRS